MIQSSTDKIRERFHIRSKDDQKLERIRRERFEELLTYLFPIQHITTNEA